MSTISWTCPFCNKVATIIAGRDTSNSSHGFDLDNIHGMRAVNTYVVRCPSEDCRKYTLRANLYEGRMENGRVRSNNELIQSWQLIPQSNSKVFPDYVPASILADYKEACVIKDLSPKASATLSRRCLQGMIRDFWEVSGRTLYDEIEAIEDKVDPATWAAIDSVRKIGNIGAHMERDINLIIDVEPNEAALLIRLIETLLNDWYVIREERSNTMKDIVEVAENKERSTVESE